MIFNSIAFLVFFVVVFFCYWFILDRNFRYQNIFLLISSYFFYGWWDWKFLFLLVGTSLLDYLIAFQMGRVNSQKKRKALLLASLFSNLGVLFFFKYCNFFIGSFV